MENIISILVIVCLAGFILGIVGMFRLLLTKEVNIFNIMTAKDLSDKAETRKKQLLRGFYVFIGAIFVMLIISAINGPVKG